MVGYFNYGKDDHSKNYLTFLPFCLAKKVLSR